MVQTVEAGYRANFRPRFDGWICQAAGPSRDTNTYSVPLRLCRAAGLQSEMRCLGIYARMCVCVCVCASLRKGQYFLSQAVINRLFYFLS